MLILKFATCCNIEGENDSSSHCIVLSILIREDYIKGIVTFVTNRYDI